MAAPSHGKLLLVTTWKNPLLDPPGKNPSDAHAQRVEICLLVIHVFLGACWSLLR